YPRPRRLHRQPDPRLHHLLHRLGCPRCPRRRRLLDPLLRRQRRHLLLRQRHRRRLHRGLLRRQFRQRLHPEHLGSHLHHRQLAPRGRRHPHRDPALTRSSILPHFVVCPLWASETRRLKWRRRHPVHT